MTTPIEGTTPSDVLRQDAGFTIPAAVSRPISTEPEGLLRLAAEAVIALVPLATGTPPTQWQANREEKARAAIAALRAAVDHSVVDEFGTAQHIRPHVLAIDPSCPACPSAALATQSRGLDVAESAVRLRDAIGGERRDWHKVEVRPDDIAAVLDPPALNVTALAEAMRFGVAWDGVPQPDEWPRIAALVAAEYARLAATQAPETEEEPR